VKIVLLVLYVPVSLALAGIGVVLLAMPVILIPFLAIPFLLLSGLPFALYLSSRINKRIAEEYKDRPLNDDVKPWEVEPDVTIGIIIPPQRRGGRNGNA
jgi:hypothetical protein